jgi:hypothetical protein
MPERRRILAVGIVPAPPDRSPARNRKPHVATTPFPAEEGCPASSSTRT